MLFWFHEFTLSKILQDPLSYTQLISTLLKLNLSGIHNKVREWDLAQKLHGQDHLNVFQKGVICECKCVTVEYTQRPFQESVINFSPLGNGEPRKAFTKWKMDINLNIKTISTQVFTFIFNKLQCCVQDSISLTFFHWNLMKQIKIVTLFY